MAKRTAVKKPKRRLRRTVRRSLAAVLMITAIVVAAIPVPENMAEDGTSDLPSDVQAALTYVKPTKDNGYNLSNPGGEHSSYGIKCSEIDVNWANNPTGELPDDLVKALKNDDKLRASYRVADVGGKMELIWEFLYHVNKSGKVILCKYNSAQKRDTVEVGNYLNVDYQTVAQEQINNYFSEDPKANYKDKANNPMDNLSPSNALYPANTVTYGVDFQTITDAERAFLAKYFADDYGKVQAAIEKYNQTGNVENGDLSEISKSPRRDLSDTQKIEFYCEHNKILNGFAGFTFKLEPVADRRLQADGTFLTGGSVYAARSEIKNASVGNYGDPGSSSDEDWVDYVTDENGYLARKGTEQVTIIGERAFAGVENVGEIKIPENIDVIGDGAFEGSKIRSVTLDNHARVGNGTFRECHFLTSVKFGENSGMREIGSEAFFACSALTEIKFPSSIRKIGYGAFANCKNLATVDFSQVRSEGCALQDFAFYNDPALTDSGLIFEGSKVVSLGKGCFALASMNADSAMTKFTFPKDVVKDKLTINDEPVDCKIGEYVLANRGKLTEVTMPEDYKGQISSTIFYNCSGLHNVIFPDTCAAASFKPDLFAHVTDETFFVRGPELYDNEPSLPRQSTWAASTRASGETGVPYVYTKNGIDCYEVAMKSGDNVYRYEIDVDGVLKSCVLVKEGKDSLDIVIPKKVGNYTVRSIGKGCFENSNLRERIRSITIQDDSIAKIDDEAFTGLEKLERVRIGNSVAYIGERAFADCKNLVDVYFNTPSAGYDSESFKMMETAFQTGGRMLTFHGDIVKGYAPFKYAMHLDHTLANNDKQRVNIRYQSLWNSKAEGTHLTVMADNSSTDRENPEVVLLDYPKLTDFSETAVNHDYELQEYCRSMERYYYDKVYDADNSTVTSKGKTVGELRTEYALLLQAAGKGKDMADLNGDGMPETSVKDDEFEKRYGPWINERFLEIDEKGYSNWANWCGSGETASLSDDDTRLAENSLYDFLFEPLVVQAAIPNKWLKPYFDAYPYDIMERYKTFKANPTGAGLDDYQTLDEAGMHFVSGTQTIIVPDGVTSIDVFRYQDADVNGDNALNYTTYQGRAETDPRFRRDTKVIGDAVPGLFSGRYEDYSDEDKRDDKDLADLEKDIRGNDVIKEVVLRSIKELPDYAFDNCEQLKSVTLGAVSKIGLLPFRGCGNMTELTGNDKYPVEKGILFEKKNTGKYKILECLTAKGRTGSNDSGLEEKVVGTAQISMLKDVDEIAKYAFEGCEDILTVNFYGVDDLKEIPEGCFKDCDRLDDVILPTSVNKIKEGAFDNVTQSDGKKKLTVTIWGREVDIADNAFAPKNGVIIKSYPDSAARRYADRYDPPIVFSELGAYTVKFYDYDGTQVGKTQEFQKKDGVDVTPTEPEEAQKLRETNHRPGYTFNGEWLGSNSKTTGIKITDKLDDELTVFVAQYDANGGGGGITPDGKYIVTFIDSLDGTTLGSYEIDAGMTFAELQIAPPAPEHTGWKFVGYAESSTKPATWTIDTVIDEPMSVYVMYQQVPTSGGSTNTSKPTTPTSKNTTSGNSGNTSGNSSNTSSSSGSSSSSSSSTSSTSTTSGTSGAGQYTVFVENGSGSGTYTPGATVIISASIPAAGMRFDKWTTESNGVTLASVSMPATTFTMPSNNVTVKANYVADNTTAATGTTGTNNTTDTTGNGHTRVDIEKPGISNRDLATATTNGSTDNFIVKISETDEATRAVAAALTNKYGTLDNILYYAMDISLYDSTGTTKITDTTGLSVDITIPIPDSLVAYGGNNMAGAVINGDQLESLNENFTTINGVPCIRFRATHFSPYTIYVDTGNLVEGMLDVTPKTGDPIHPKWFLSIGLACLSVILFLKRDKKLAVKA